jgi:hypothetical protein
MFRSVCFFVFVLLSVLTTQTFGQAGSLLQQLMASNPLIVKNEHFREMQDTLRAKLGDIKPGVHLDLVYDLLGKARVSILNGIGVDFISYKNNSDSDTLHGIVTIKFTAMKEYSLTVDRIYYRKVLLDSLQKRIESSIIEYLNTAIRNSPDLRRSLLYPLAETFETLYPVPIMAPQDTGENRAAKIIAAYIRSRLDIELNRVGLPENESLLSKDIVEKLDTIAKYAVSSTRETIGQAFDKVEHEIASSIDGFQKWAVEGNVGVGVSSANTGKGLLGGGVVLVINGSHWQNGVFVNGMIQGDSAMKEPLLGIRSRYARDIWQVDFILSALLNKNIYEAGLGSSWAFSGVILGVSGIVSNPINESREWIAGGSLGPKIPGGVSYFLGYRWNKQNGGGIVQINLPILPSKL